MRSLGVDWLTRLPYSPDPTEYGASEVDGSPSDKRFGEGQSGCRTRAQPARCIFAQSLAGIEAELVFLAGREVDVRALDEDQRQLLREALDKVAVN